MRSKIRFFVFLACIAGGLTFQLESVVEMVKMSKEIVVGLGKVWDIVENQADGELPLPFVDKAERRLLRKIHKINKHLDVLSTKVDNIGANTIAALLHTVPERMRLELRLNDLFDYLTRIDVIYSRMEDYVKATHKYERLTLEDFARSIISHDGSSVVNLMERIHTYLVPHGEGLIRSGILGLLLKSFQEANDMICGNRQSAQQILYSLYNAIALTEIKGYTMVQFSYMLLKLYDKGNFTKESALTRMNYEERSNQAVQVVKNAMKEASREYWRCDPKDHVKGKTYEEITQLLQGYIINEVDMNSDGTCRENCQEYQYAKNYGCFKNLFCRQQRPCNGKILNCKFIDSDMEVCTADPRSGRRYESIEYENGLVYGRKQSCPRGVTKVDSWWRWLFWHCSYCRCICDEQGAFSDRYFNMRPVIADIENNKVVTGLRFVKKNRIIHLQIQQGTLGPFGIIISNSTGWKEVEDYRIHDRSVYSGRDYHILTWEKRALDLDDLVADANHVLTGVKFKEIGSHLNFEIYTSPFNFSTGKLIEPLEKSVWKDNPNTDVSHKHPRSKVTIYSPDVPTRSPSPSTPASRTDQFIEFTHTDFERDAAQTTVPFLDAQPVDMLEPVPLAGAGLFYKGKVNYGGFITPKVITYDYSEHIKPIFPEPIRPIQIDDASVTSREIDFQ